MDVVLQGFLKHEGEVRTLGTVAVMVVALIVHLGHGHVEHPLGPLYLGGYFGQIRYLQRRTVLLDDVHHRDVVKIEGPVFYAEFVLRKLEGLLDQIDVLVLHTR